MTNNTTAHSVTWRTEIAEADEPAIRRLALATGFFRPDEVDIAAELARERFQRGPESGYEFILADDDAGRLIGYACFGPIACTVGSYDLYWIIVDPALQGRGLGRALVRESERAIRAAGGRRIYIETSSLPKYDPTRRFYTACGYTLEATLRDFYLPGDDKLIYSASVAPLAH